MTNCPPKAKKLSLSKGKRSNVEVSRLKLQQVFKVEKENEVPDGVDPDSDASEFDPVGEMSDDTDSDF